MKPLFLTALLSLMFAPAFAGNEGPQAAPPNPGPAVIAEFSVGGGLRPPSSPYAISVTIDSAGVVRYVEEYGGGRDKSRKVAVLSADTLASLEAHVEAVQSGELKDPNPKRPGCVDAPSSDYQVIKKSGERIGIAARRACKDYEKEDATEADVAVIKALDAAWVFAHL